MVETFKGRDTIPPCVKLELHIPAIVAIVYEIARVILKHILEQINEMEVEKYCGKRYERAKSLRNGKRRSKIVTLLGEVILSLKESEVKECPYTTWLNSNPETINQISKQYRLTQL